MASHLQYSTSSEQGESKCAKMCLTANKIHAISSHQACSMPVLVPENSDFQPVFNKFSGPSSAIKITTII